MNDRCPHCGALIAPQDHFCPQCGGSVNEKSAYEDTWQPGTVPKTIDELKSWCAYNEMPLEKMRFFIGEDYPGARAFGIFHQDGNTVVYKNKADGSRAVRYNGPDEACAVSEIYAKIIEECGKRGIFPEGAPRPAIQETRAAKKRKNREFIIFAVVFFLIFGVAGFLFLKSDNSSYDDSRDGYYYFDDGLYYYYDDYWYYGEDDDWVRRYDMVYDDSYADSYMGPVYDDSWGYSDFQQSDAWNDIQREREQERSISSDFDSWDSNDTNWDSDW